MIRNIIRLCRKFFARYCDILGERTLLLRPGKFKVAPYASTFVDVCYTIT